MADTHYSIEELKCTIAPIAEKYQISKVYLFGSYAKGDYHEQSDIDLRIRERGNEGAVCFVRFLYRTDRGLENKSRCINNWKSG